MRMKRIFALLMTFVLLLGAIPADGMGSLLFPVIAQAAPVTEDGYIIDGYNLKITGQKGWKFFADECYPKNKGMEGWTVTLENDIEILPNIYSEIDFQGMIPSADDFKGKFDGKGHYIKIDGNKQPTGKPRRFAGDAGAFPNGLGSDVGLFRNLMGSAEVKNLIVWLEGSLVASTYSQEIITNYGALVGQMSDNSKLLNCALVGSGTVENLTDIGNRTNPGLAVVSVGSMVGDMAGNSKAEGLYSEVNVKNDTAGTFQVMDVWMRTIWPTNITGGIVGSAAPSCTISNSIYMGPFVEIGNTAVGSSQSSNFGGCIVGNGGSVSACYTKNTQIKTYCNDVSNQPIQGYYGYIGSRDSKIKQGTCYSNAVIHRAEGSSENTDGFRANINGVDAVMMGSAWVDTMEGFPSLKWLVTPLPLDKVTVTADNANALTIAPPYVNYSGDTGYNSGKGDSLWNFNMEIPIKGRTAPLTADLTLTKTTAPGVSSCVITLPTPPPADKTKYYFKFAATPEEAKTESEIVYTSTAMLTNSTHNYDTYTPSGINVELTDATKKYLLLVAVNEDIGRKLPSAVTYFALPNAPPTTPSEQLTCINTAANPEKKLTVGKIIACFYSDNLGANNPPPSQPLTWAQLLPYVRDTEVTPLSTEYIATGDIKVTAYPAKDRFGQDIDIARGSRFVASASGSGIQGDVAPRPTIYPRNTGIITDGVTISVPDGTTVFYTAVAGALTPLPPEVTVKPDGTFEAKGDKTKKYTAGAKIPFPDNATSFVVCAAAWETGKQQSDIDYVLYKNDSNLLTPTAPTLLLDGIKYNIDSTYPENSKLIFDHPELADGKVLFTVNGEEPIEGRYNTKTFKSSGGDGTNIFDPSKPYEMNGTGGFVSIRAKFCDAKKLLESPVTTYLISVKQNLSAPVANVANNAMVRPNTSLELSLSDEAIAQLNTNGKTAVKRDTYTAELDKAFPADAVNFSGDTPQVGMQYVSYQVDSSSQAYSLPVIRYRLGDDKTNLAGSGTIYRYGQRRVLSTYETTTGTDGKPITTTKVTITYTNPQPIALTGAVGQKIKVNAMAVSGMEVRADSPVVTFNYTIRSAMEKPTAFPITDPARPASINIGDRIALSSATSDALIFYTLDGSEPKVKYTPPTAPDAAGSWAPLDASTKLYNETQSIKMESNAQLLFTIRAIAVSKNFSLENSPEALFLYQPPASVPAVFASPIQGAVVVNQAITLRCATEDARIFYKTFTSAPDITSAQGKLDNIPQPNRDQIFDPKVPITITKPTWIVAVAEKNGAMSTPTVNAYTIAPTLTEPTSSLKTGSVVHKGTRIHLTSTGSIAYTLDGSDPKAGMAALQAVPPPAAKDTPAVLFGDSLVIDGEYGKSVIVKAFTYGEGHTPSNVATFTYTICDKDTYITAVPAKGAVITNGSTITLTTTLSDGLMFYSTGSNTPTIINRYDDDGWYNWDAEDKKHESYDTYQWRAGTGTRRSNSVRVNGASGSTFTVKAIAVANGSEGGSTQVFTYTIRERTAAPSASVPNGAVALEGAKVTLSAQEGDIFYTVDGSEPTTSSRLYVEPIPITGSMVLKTIALAKDKTASDVAEYIYSYADQAFAPSMSIPGGEIEQGSRITLTSPTEGASIYYSTNGADPTDKSTLYTSPIAVMRPVTIKAIAIKKELRSSAVNSASYTVVEPQRPDIDEGGGNDKPKTQLDSLVSRRTYFDETAGPKFSDVIIRDTTTNTILSANGTAVPAGAELVVKQVDSSDSDREAVRTALNYHIVSLYDVSLERNGEVVEPEGQVEIGIPIPADYQNGMVAICRVGTDNTVEEYEPRRSGNNAYITVEGKLDRYAVVVPEVNKELSTQLSVWQIFLISVLTAVGAGGVTLGVIRFIQKRRRAAAQNAYTDAPDHFND